MRRIDKFLNLDELDDDCVEEDPTMTGNKIQYILCSHSSFGFQESAVLNSFQMPPLKLKMETSLGIE